MSPEEPADCIWRRSADVAFVDSPGRVAMLDLRELAKAPVILEETAAAIWSAVDGMRDEEAIVGEVAQQYRVEPTEVAEQVARLLTQLASMNLIERFR